MCQFIFIVQLSEAISLHKSNKFLHTEYKQTEFMTSEHVEFAFRTFSFVISFSEPLQNTG